MQKPPPTSRPDRRVRRTREALRDALLELLPETGWDDIDVATLCERADIGRSTFYLHYTDKTDLLRGAFDDLHTHLLATAAASPGHVEHPFLPGLLQHVHEQRDVFRALLGRRSGQVVQDHFRDLLIRLFGADHDARTHLLAGSLFQLLVWWLGSARHHLPAEVEARFRAFAVSGSPAVGSP